MAGERAQKTDLQSQLRGAISDNTRMVRDMTRLQHQIQAQADSRDDELKEVQQEVCYSFAFRRTRTLNEFIL